MLLLSSQLMPMLTMLLLLRIESPIQVMSSTLTATLFHGLQRSSHVWQLVQLTVNTSHVMQLLQRLFGYADFLPVLAYLKDLLLFSLIARTPCVLLSIPNFIPEQSMSMLSSTFFVSRWFFVQLRFTIFLLSNKLLIS